MRDLSASSSLAWRSAVSTTVSRSEDDSKACSIKSIAVAMLAAGSVSIPDLADSSANELGNVMTLPFVSKPATLVRGFAHGASANRSVCFHPMQRLLAAR